MHPILLKIGPLTLYTYGALVALGFYLGYRWTLRGARQQGISREIVGEFCWIALLSGLLGARLLYASFNLGYFQVYPMDLFKIWQGGLVWYGGLFLAALVCAPWLKKHNVPALLMADIAAPGLALGHAVGRVGCFMAGCCYGKPHQGPWAVVFKNPQSLAPHNIPLHPAQLYEAAADFVLFIVLALLSRGDKRLGRGRLAALYVFFYGLIRLSVEFFRSDERGPVFLRLTSTQWMAAAFVLGAVIFLGRPRNIDA